MPLMKGEPVRLEVRSQVTKEEIALYVQMPQEWQLLAVQQPAFHLTILK